MTGQLLGEVGLKNKLTNRRRASVICGKKREERREVLRYEAFYQTSRDDVSGNEMQGSDPPGAPSYYSVGSDKTVQTGDVWAWDGDARCARR